MGRFPRVASIVLLALTAAVLAPAAASASHAELTSQGDPDPQYDGGPSPEVAAPVVSAFSDVGGAFSFAKPAINFVAHDHLWMQDFGKDKFRPGLDESRRLFARTMARAFGTTETVDPSITFSDLDSSDPFYDDANIAVQNGWMRADGTKFHPDSAMTIYTLYRALVNALPLTQEVHGLADLHSADGYRFVQPPTFPTTELGMRLGFRYNHTKEALDLDPQDPIPRGEVAYSLWKAKTLPSYKFDEVKPFRTIELPTLTAPMRKVVEWDARYVGYPYIWGGEWFKKNNSQPTGGWDCSGFMWWSLKKPVSWYDPTKAGRPYNGWKLLQRTSATMASTGGRIGYSNLKPGDLMLYDGNNDHTVDHVDMYVGGGWSFDTGSSVGGTSLLWSGNGSWYKDHFVHGRRIM